MIAEITTSTCQNSPIAAGPGGDDSHKRSFLTQGLHFLFAREKSASMVFNVVPEDVPGW